MHEGSRKAVIVAFAANLGIACAKFVGFAVTGASSMLAEAVHSLADTGNQGLLLLGATRAARQATPKHPFGHARERYFWSFIVAVVIFVLGGVFAAYEGIQKLYHPHELEEPAVAVGILLFAWALEAWSFRTAFKEANALRGEQSWLAFVRHTRAAELPVVLLEDLGAMVGLSLALLGVGLTALTGEPRFDALGSIGIGALLMVLAWVLASEMGSLLIGEGADAEVEAQIHQALEQAPVRRVIHLRTNHLGPEELLVAAKLEFDHSIQFVDLAEAIDAAERRVRERVPIARHIYLEPDVYREGRAQG
jgi:cation diffusion facilitator family transporter